MPCRATGHTDRVLGVAIVPDGTWPAKVSRDRTARTWAAAGTPRAVLTGHHGPVNAVAIAPDGSRLATASRDRTARTWAVTGSPRPLTAIRVDGEVSDCSFFPSGTALCIGGQHGLYRFSLQAPPG